MIYIEKRAFPGSGKTLVFFGYEGELKKNDYFTKLNDKVNGKLLATAETHSFSGKKHEHIIVEGGSLYEHIIVYGVGKKAHRLSSELRELVAGAVRLANTLKTGSMHFYIPHAFAEDYEEAGKEVALAFYLAQYRFNKYKGKEHAKKQHTIQDLHISFENEPPATFRKGIDEGTIIAKGVMLTRDLVNEPASFVHPATLVTEASRIAKESKGAITAEVLDAKKCKELGMGAFLGVAAGSDHPPQFIVLTYRPGKKTSQSKKICFVGKSITFDSGGLSLKPSKAMEDMKIDMAGGASVLGVFQILAQGIQTPHEVVGILPACENMPSGKALRPGDVVTALNGKTIEVLNTDAEGRLALADAVSYAEKIIKPDLIIDFATLTGACMVALGEDIAGVFGNDEHEVKRFIEATKKEHEPAWELPLFHRYLELMDSDIADIKNVAGKGYGGAITAALFIGEFVSKTKWIHVDIAGPAHNTGKITGTVGRGGTGWGVMSIISLLQSA